MWKSIILSTVICSFVASCGGGSSGSGDGGSNNDDMPVVEGSNLPVGIAVAALATLPSQNDTLVLQEVDTVYTSRVDGSTHTNGSTFYLADTANQISEKNDYVFTPAYLVSDGVICVSGGDRFTEIRVNISYGGETTEGVLYRPCGVGEVDFTAFESSDLIAISIATSLLDESALTQAFPFGPAILQEDRDRYAIASRYGLDFDTDSTTNMIRFFPSGLSLVDERDSWTYVPAYLDRTSGHICVSDTETGGYMMVYFSRDTNAVTTIGDRLILDLFSAGSSLNPEAMIYWGARCE